MGHREGGFRACREQGTPRAAALASRLVASVLCQKLLFSAFPLEEVCSVAAGWQPLQRGYSTEEQRFCSAGVLETCLSTMNLSLGPWVCLFRCSRKTGSKSLVIPVVFRADSEGKLVFKNIGFKKSGESVHMTSSILAGEN